MKLCKEKSEDLPGQPWDEDWRSKLQARVDEAGSYGILAVNIGLSRDTIRSYLKGGLTPSAVWTLKSLRAIGVRPRPKMLAVNCEPWVWMVWDRVIDLEMSLSRLADEIRSSIEYLSLAMRGANRLSYHSSIRMEELLGFSPRDFGLKCMINGSIAERSGLGLRMALARAGLGMSQADLGHIVGVSSNTIRKIELGRYRRKSYGILERIGREIGVDLIDEWPTMDPGLKLKWYRTFHLEMTVLDVSNETGVSISAIGDAERARWITFTESRTFYALCKKYEIPLSEILSDKDFRMEWSPFDGDELGF